MKFEQNWLSGFREEAIENVNGWMHGQTDNRRKVITIAHPEHSSGELKKGIFVHLYLRQMVLL